MCFGVATVLLHVHVHLFVVGICLLCDLVKIRKTEIKKNTLRERERERERVCVCVKRMKL